MIRSIKNLFFRRRAPAHLESGEWGEALAAKMLRRKGYKILGKRIRFGSRLELDIVARDGDTLVFVEVKTRKSEQFGRPVAAVDGRKKETLTRAALKYLRKLKRLPDYIRFDVVEVVGSPSIPNPEIRHLENVFTLDPRYRLPFKFEGQSK